jgi:hypothetical protein
MIATILLAILLFASGVSVGVVYKEDPELCAFGESLANVVRIPYRKIVLAIWPPKPSHLAEGELPIGHPQNPF